MLALVIGLSLGTLALPRATAACSCAQPGPLAGVRGDPEIAVFTGTVDVRDPRGFPVTVTRWFQGGGLIERRVWFTANSFSGDGASCGVAPLPVGTEWIFVAYRTDGMYGTGLCSPHAATATAEGQAMLAEAARTFGAPASIGPDPTTDPPSIRPDPDVASLAGVIVGTIGPLVLVVVFGTGLLLGLVGVLKRTRFGQD
jgi:hypothetical protein